MKIESIKELAEKELPKRLLDYVDECIRRINSRQKTVDYREWVEWYRGSTAIREEKP